jgi:hypothetical protein
VTKITEMFSGCNIINAYKPRTCSL